MQSTDIPTRFPEAFAKNASASYKRAIPTSTGDPNAASLDSGFPPNVFVPQNSGGVPMDGRDLNGILNQVSAWCQWFSTGGPVFWDSTFSTAIGGYPKGAVVQALTQDKWWVSVVENNATNPDTGGAGWVSAPFILSNAYSIPINGVLAMPSTTANPLTVTASGAVFLASGTLGAASLYPLGRVTTHYNPVIQSSPAGGAGKLLYKVGTNYVLAATNAGSIYSAPSLAGAWANNPGVLSTIAMQSSLGLCLVNGAVSNVTTNGSAWSSGTITNLQWTDGDASSTSFITIQSGRGGATGGTSFRTSGTGLAWITRALPAFNWKSAIAFGGGTWLYVTSDGSGSQIATNLVGRTSTDDGVTWSAPFTIVSGADADLNFDISLEYVGSRFFLSLVDNGSGNSVLSSANATAWTATTGLPHLSSGNMPKQNFSSDGAGNYFTVASNYFSTNGIAFAYPGVAGQSVAAFGGSSTTVYLDGDYRALSDTGGNLKIVAMTYTVAGYVGLPYALPAPVVPAPLEGPTDLYTMYVRVN